MKVRIILPFFSAELKRIWRRPIFEGVIGVVFFFCVSTATKSVFITSYERFGRDLMWAIADPLIAYTDGLWFLLVLICAVLVNLSLAGDYERGFLQGLLSQPLSRLSILASKILAIALPLTAITWCVVVFSIGLNYHCVPETLLRTSILSLPIFLLICLFSTGFAATIALAVKKMMPSMLIAIMTVFALAFAAGGIFGNYLNVLPVRAPTILLSYLMGIKLPSIPEEVYKTLPSTPGFLVLNALYALLPNVLACFYFSKRFEVKE